MSALSTSRRAITGWGRGPGSVAGVALPSSPAELTTLIDDRTMTKRRFLARGLGRSYGDAAQCGGGTLIDCTVMDGIDTVELDAGRIRVGAGCSLDRLLRVTVPRGWFVPVTPGTAYVTVGGAIAADVHGKNHHREGSIGAYVESLVLMTPEGPREVGPTADQEVFWATVGGMGLTGIIASANLRLLRVETSKVLVDTERAADLETCMDRLSSGDANYRYSVAWVDGVARGRGFGRSVITSGDHARLSDLSAGAEDPCAYAPRQRFSLPLVPPTSMVTPTTTAAFNELWFRRAPVRRDAELQPLAGFFYPLDAVGAWNGLYGPRGFAQYQFAVPFGEEKLVRIALERLQAIHSPASLVVLKRFGPGDDAPLSFPIPGWTLALDIPLGAPGLPGVLDGLDDLVADAGGRVYLAKDGRLRPDLVRAMYPRLTEWEAVRDRLDPAGLVSSDLSRRLGIGARGAGWSSGSKDDRTHGGNGRT